MVQGNFSSFSSNRKRCGEDMPREYECIRLCCFLLSPGREGARRSSNRWRSVRNDRWNQQDLEVQPRGRTPAAVDTDMILRRCTIHVCVCVCVCVNNVCAKRKCFITVHNLTVSHRMHKHTLTHTHTRTHTHTEKKHFDTSVPKRSDSHKQIQFWLWKRGGLVNRAALFRRLYEPVGRQPLQPLALTSTYTAAHLINSPSGKSVTNIFS